LLGLGALPPDKGRQPKAVSFRKSLSIAETQGLSLFISAFLKGFGELFEVKKLPKKLLICAIVLEI
jgi:hypothetical protein